MPSHPISGFILTLAALSCSASARAEDDALLAKIPDNFAVAAAQYERMLESLQGDPKLPRTMVDGRVHTVGQRDWTSGFFPGSLWLLFDYTRDSKWREAAEDYTARLEGIKDFRGHHDVGFMLYCSYGQGLRLANPPGYRDVLLQGAASLATRFQPEVGLIKSWDSAEWGYPVIIDNMMNLELLEWAARTGGEERFRTIAVSHADRTLRNHFRADGSSFHLVDYNPESGAVQKKQTVQGVANDSAWARGQAWGLYGYTMMYRETRTPAYLEQARKIAGFILNHPRLPEDKVPYWDFDAPGIPDAPRDASAAAIMASALIELSGYVEPAEGARFLGLARQQLLSLSSPAYRAQPGGNGHFILMHSVGHFGRGVEVDAPLNYADYYFLEALLRYRAKTQSRMP
ncbi:MAG TPA: hypothetical protein VGD81_20690 [Opitutaceae bacterium]